MSDSQIPLDAQSTALSRLLESATLKVPDFQRPYSWEEDQLNDLWGDVLDSARNGSQYPHFFGTLLTAAPDDPLRGNTWDVLDGQQRLTTFTLLLIALDRHLEELDSPDAAKTVRLGVESTRARIRKVLFDEDTRRLRLRTEDDHFLANLLTGNPGGGSGGGLVGKAFARLHERVEARLAASEDQFGELKSLTEAILDKSVVIHAHCRAGFDSFVVFSTLNATGLPLTATQILRARSLGLVSHLSQPVREETKLAWDAVEQLKDDADRFLQAFLVLRTGNRIQVKDVVRTFDNHVLKSKELPSSAAEKEAHFASIARELKVLIPAYRDLATGDWPTTVAEPDGWHASRIKLLIRTLGNRQLLPILLASACTRDVDFAKLLDVIERAAFVALVCFDNQTRWGDRTFQLAAGIYGGSMSTEGIVESIQEFFKLQLISPRERLAARLPEQLRYNGRRKTLIRYFLTTLNDWGFPGQPTREPDIQATWVLSDIHIDHISAQRGTDTLTELDRDRLGNLTPLKGKENISLSNKPFDQKTTIYGESPLRITRALRDLSNWTPAEVDARERAMIGFAAELFCRDLPPLIPISVGATD